MVRLVVAVQETEPGIPDFSVVTDVVGEVVDQISGQQAGHQGQAHIQRENQEKSQKDHSGDAHPAQGGEQKSGSVEGVVVMDAMGQEMGFVAGGGPGGKCHFIVGLKLAVVTCLI